MKPTLYAQLADVFEKLAECEEMYGRPVETPKSEEKAADREGNRPALKERRDNVEKGKEPASAKEAAEAFRELTGVDLDASIAAKIAGDASMVDRLRKLAAEQRVPERLGGPSDRPGERPAPRTKEEAKQAAWDRFGEFLANGHTDA